MASFVLAGVITDGAVNPTADTLYQSTMGGGMWTPITARLPAADFAGGIDYVAIAPDDPQTVVVATANPTAGGLGAAISVDGGAIWSSMGTIQDGGAVNVVTAIYDLDVSRLVTGNFRYVALSGTAGANLPALYYYNYGSGVGAWRNACLATGLGGTDFNTGPVLGDPLFAGAVVAYDNVRAFEFSNNFTSDFMGVAILEEATAGANDDIDYHILSFNSLSWDNTIQVGYPTRIYLSAGAITVVNADIALFPDFDGQDDTTRIGFTGMNVIDGGAEGGGVWRHRDAAPAAKILGTPTALGISSVAYDGTNVIAGESLTNNVWRSADPLVTLPTFLPSRNLKEIGIDDGGGVGINDMLNIKFVDETLYGSKLGDASCISRSTDYGHTWNDYTLLDSALTVIDDIYMIDSMTWYISAHDGVTSSVYRVEMFAVTRVLCVPILVAGAAPAAANPDFMLRGTPADPLVVYAADEGGAALYYTADGGLERWYLRGSVPIAMVDMCVESAQIIYIADAASVNIYKSLNAGFVWSLPINTTLAGMNAVINTIISVGENNVVVGGNAGGVAYTTDGGDSWTNTMGVFNAFAPVQIAASGLATGDYIFASEEANNTVWRCEISPANFVGEFETMNFPAPVLTEVNTGLVLHNGILYVLQTDAAGGGPLPVAAGTSYIARSAAPTIPGKGAHIGLFWGTVWAETGAGFMGIPTTLTFNLTPSALKVSDGPPGSIYLYAVDTASWLGPGVHYYDDALILGGPSLIAPADGDRVDVIAPLVGGVANVNFTWSRISLATAYALQIALDENFTEPIPFTVGGVTTPFLPVASAIDPVSAIVAGATFTPGDTYYWRVWATAPISSGFSETRSLVVEPTAAAVPNISSPENGGSIDSTSPAFSWTPTVGATKYQFQLSDDPSFATTLADEQVEAAGIMPAVTLERGKTYFWRVRAIEPIEGGWSTVGNFMVAMEAPAPAPPVVIEQTPAPVIEIPPAPPAQVIEIPPAPPVEKIAPAYIWAIIIIGAVLVIAVIVLIVRTRRQV
jgi:hypothetical protein